MKFETPIADIQKFDLKDVISASGETETEYDGPTYERANSLVPVGHCSMGAPDFGGEAGYCI